MPTKPTFRGGRKWVRKTRNPSRLRRRRGGIRHRALQLHDLNAYEPSIKLLKASFDPLFVERVRRNIEHPEVVEGMVSEVCGSMNMDENLRLSHDPLSADGHSNEYGFQRGGVEEGSEGRNQFCQPKTYASRILWHTHPKGVPAYPSGSDIFVTLIRDCSDSDNAQAYLEFLFTEYGFWIIHRKITPENTLVPAIDISKRGGRGIKMREVETIISKIEDQSIRPQYYREARPTRNSATEIANHLLKLTYENLVHISFHDWDTREFELPEALFTVPMSQVCVRE